MILSKGTSIPNMNAIQIKTKTVIKISLWLSWQVSIAMSYVADAYYLYEPPCQIQTQYNLKPWSY